MGRVSRRAQIYRKKAAVSRSFRWRRSEPVEAESLVKAEESTGVSLNIKVESEETVETDNYLSSGRMGGEDVKLEVDEESWNEDDLEEMAKAAGFLDSKDSEERLSNSSQTRSVPVNLSLGKTQFNCLLCNKNIKSETASLLGMYLNQARTSLEANFDAMFILKKMLSVPNEKLAYFLEHAGNPSEWIGFCEKCIDLVDEAVRIQSEIRKLEESLRERRKEMITKIQDTWKRRRRQNRTSGCGPTDQIRQLVVERKLSRNEEDYIEDEAGLPEVESEGYLMANDNPIPNEIAPDTIDLDEVNPLYDGQYSCHLCPSLNSMSLHNLADHVMFHYRRPLKCSHCHLYYSSEASLKPPTETENHQCSSDTIITIQFKPIDITPWKCAHCPEAFTSVEGRDSHFNSVHSDLPNNAKSSHECVDCSKGFQNLGEWRLHRALEHPEAVAYGCSFCNLSLKTKSKDGMEFCDYEKLQSHLKTNHWSLRPSTFSLMRLPDECDLCGAFFPRFADLHKHMEDAHQLPRRDSYPCPVCPMKTSEWKLLLLHINRRHCQDPILPGKMCDTCGFKCRGITRFEEHQFHEHGVLPESRPVLNCSKENCSFQCLDKYKLERHMMKEHASERKLKCEVCGKGFLNLSHLKIHEQIHLNASLKPFQCEICGSSFAVKNYLYIHMRLSHQNRPFASTHKKKQRKKQSSSFAREDLTFKTSETPGDQNNGRKNNGNNQSMDSGEN